MEWVETTGKTVEAALDAALDELGVDESEVEYEVIDAPRGGVLGLFGGAARIRARVKPVSREKPGARRGRDKRGGRSGGANGGKRPASPPRGSGGTAGGADGDRARRETGGRRPRRTQTSENGESTERKETRSKMSEQSEPVIPVEEQVEIAVTFVKGLIERIGVSGEVTGRAEGDDDVHVDVEGDGLGLLVGPKAVTLQAIQELARTAVQRRTGGHAAWVHVDVGGYKERRRLALTELVVQVAERVTETGQEEAFEPMAAPDRKIIHDAVQAIDGVSTFSEGEEPRRRVVITRD